jgi:hypothetical protein
VDQNCEAQLSGPKETNWPQQYSGQNIETDASFDVWPEPTDPLFDQKFQ